MAAPLAYTTVSAQYCTDAAGNLISNATISFQPCNNQGVAISFRVGATGQVVSRAVLAQVNSGAFSINLPDTTLTSPANVAYLVTITDNTTRQSLLGPGYTIQPFGSTWNFDTFVPNVGSTLATIQNGPVGATGTPGVLTGVYNGPLTLAPTITIPGAVVDQATPSKVPNTYVDLVTDKNGNIQAGVRASGLQDFNAGVNVSGGTTTDTLASQSSMSYSSSTALTSLLANSVVDQATPSNSNSYVECLTDKAGNTAWGVDATGNFHVGADLILHGTTKSVSGLFATPNQPQNLEVSAAINTSLTKYAANVYACTGQSLGAGLHSVPLISTVQQYNNEMLVGDVRCGVDNGSAIASSTYTSIVPLVEAVDNSGVSSGVQLGQTIASSMGQLLSFEFMKRGFVTPGEFVNACYTGHDYASIKQGTQTYNNLLTMVTALKTYTTGPIGVRCVSLVHGENDDYEVNPNYTADIIALQSNYQTDLSNITGQTDTIFLQLCQQNSWTSYAVKATPVTAQQQLAACEQNSNILFVCPKYNLPYYSDGIHLSAQGEYYLGEYHAKCSLTTQLGLYWTGLRPRPGYPVRIGKHIAIDFFVPVTPLVLDTHLVTQPTNVAGSMYGFEFDDGSGAPPAISNVQIVGNTTVMLTLAALPNPPSGATMYVRYAYTGVPGAAAGPTTGARGNLRDSDPYPSQLDGTQLPNWCATFIKPVS